MLVEDKIENIEFDKDANRMTGDFSIDSETGEEFTFSIKAGFFEEEEFPTVIFFRVYRKPMEEEGEEVMTCGFDVAKKAIAEGDEPVITDDTLPIDVKKRMNDAMKSLVTKFLISIEFEKTREAIQAMLPDFMFRIKAGDKEEDEGKEKEKK